MAKKKATTKNKGKAKAPLVSNLVLKQKDQYYALVEKICGDCRFEITLQSNQATNVATNSSTSQTTVGGAKFDSTLDTKKYVAHLRGQLKKKTKIFRGDYVLVSKRDVGDDKYDIIHKYSNSDIRTLMKRGELKMQFSSGINSGLYGDDVSGEKDDMFEMQDQDLEGANDLEESQKFDPYEGIDDEDEYVGEKFKKINKPNTPSNNFNNSNDEGGEIDQEGGDQENDSFNDSSSSSEPEEEDEKNKYNFKFQDDN